MIEAIKMFWEFREANMFWGNIPQIWRAYFKKTDNPEYRGWLGVQYHLLCQQQAFEYNH